MKLIDGAIIPNVGISNIYLGISRETLISNIGLDFKTRLIDSGCIIEIDNAKFWIDKMDTIYQISVFGDFNGKLFNCIGINSSLEDVLKNIGKYKYEPYCYTLLNYPGICFELEDVDNWCELKTPIEFISVFKIKS